MSKISSNINEYSQFADMTQVSNTVITLLATGESSENQNQHLNNLV